MNNTLCLAGPAFSITGDALYADQQVDFDLVFDSSADEAGVQKYEWYLNAELVPGQNQKNFSGKVPCGSYFIKARILTDQGWSGLKSLNFVTCEVLSPFNFTDQSGLDPGTLAESNAITVPGNYSGYPIAIANGQYQINAGEWTSAAGTVNSGDLVKIRTTSSPLFNTSVSPVLNIGSQSDTWNIITRAAVAIPVYYHVVQQVNPYVNGGYLMQVNGGEVVNHVSTSDSAGNGPDMIHEGDVLFIEALHYTGYRWPDDASLSITIKDSTNTVIHTYTGGSVPDAVVETFTFTASSPSYTIDVQTNSNDTTLAPLGFTLQNLGGYPDAAITLAVTDDTTSLVMLADLTSSGSSSLMGGAFNVKNNGGTMSVPITNHTGNPVQVRLFNDYGYDETFTVPGAATVTKTALQKAGIHVQLI